MTAPLPPDEPIASVSAPQRTASQLGFQVRHAAASPVEPVAGVHIAQQGQIAPVSGLSDPWGAQAGGPTAGQRLMNADAFRRTPGPQPLAGAAGGEESPLGDTEGALSDTLGSDPFGERQAAKSAQIREDAAAKYPPRIQNDADPPSQGIHDLRLGARLRLGRAGMASGDLQRSAVRSETSPAMARAVSPKCSRRPR